MPTVGIRVTEAQKIELEDRSARFGNNVSEYVKDVLFGKQHEALEGILRRLDELASRAPSVSSRPPAGDNLPAPEQVMTMLAEALVLLRFSLKPDQMRAARAEIDRLQIQTWGQAASSEENTRG